MSTIVIGWGDMAKPAHRFIAFDKRNGQPVWFEGTRLLPYDTTYSSPVLAVINGESQMIFGSGDGGVHGFQPHTGKRIWTYNVSRRGINTTPLVVVNTIYCAHSEENIDDNTMGSLFAIDATQKGDISKSGELWRQKQWLVGKSSPIEVDGRIYAVEDKGTLLVVDAKTGKRIASERLRGPMRSSPVYADGKIYVFTRNSVWWTFEPTETGGKVLQRARLSAGESHGTPIISHGRMYIPTTKALYCVGSKDQTPSADPIPETAQLAPVEDDPAPAFVQLVPAESLLKPGMKQQLDIRIYNARGQYLRMAEANEVSFTNEGPGSIDQVEVEKRVTDENGNETSKPTMVWYYTTPHENVHAAVIITAKMGEFSAIPGSRRTNRSAENAGRCSEGARSGTGTAQERTSARELGVERMDAIRGFRTGTCREALGETG